MYRCDNQCCKARTTRVAEAVALAIAITVAAAVAVALYSVAVTVAIPVGPDWASLERNFWPKRANKASDADRLAVKMRIAEVTVVRRLYVSATFPGATSNYLVNVNTYSEVADILDGLFDGSA